MKYVVGFQDCNRSNIPYMDSMGCKIPILKNILNVSEKHDLGLLKILCDVKDLVVHTNRLGPVVWISLGSLKLEEIGILRAV